MVAQWFEPTQQSRQLEVIEQPQQVPVVSVDDMEHVAFNGSQSYDLGYFDGDKFPGGFGATQLQITDYWTLRARSSQLFNDNLYARGLIRRLITNEINTGLTPEASPDADILGVGEDELNNWTESVETRFGIWGKSPKVCDYKQVSTFGAIQREARREALIAGDVLVVLRPSRRYGLPRVQLVSGSSVQSPLASDVKLRKGNTITHGVERNTLQIIVAHWIRQKDGDYKRIPAVGEKSGRTISYLVYGTDKRLDDVRGQPLLSLIMQSLKEVDRYRDSVQRKAVVNSIMAMFIQKDQDKMGTLPVTGAAVRKGTTTVTDTNGSSRNFNVSSQMPGVVMEELQHGEKPIAFESASTDLNFGVFEEAIIQAVAWANEIPPEILKLSFSNNYSASQAAINEFKIYLEKFWTDWGETFCTPIYADWLISETLSQKVVADGLLESWRNPRQYDVLGAWLTVEWYGSIKPSTDMLKQTKGSEMALSLGLTTHAREARGLTGTKFTKNVARLKRENELLADANRPLLELEAEFAPSPSSDKPDGGSNPTDDDDDKATDDNIFHLVDEEV